MGFIIGLVRTSRKHGSITVVVDRLTKVYHLIAVKSINSTSDIAHRFIKKIVRFHGVPKKIVSEKYIKYTSKF